ncbi:MAG TPA: LCP family protein, partial [Candidatus Xenobia bacterium]
PRDMYIVYPNGTHDKINGAYSDGGVPLARKTIEQFLGIHIDHYVVLKIQGTARLIDALGGLKINVEKDMSYDDNWGYLHVHLKKGWQHLNGMQAVGYARFRHDAESDFGRIRRQQQIVDTLIQQLKKPENFNLQKLQELAGLFRKYVSTDLNVPQMVDLAWVYQSFDRRNMIAGYIPGDDGWVGDMSVLTPPDKGTIRKMVRRVLVGTGEWQVADVTTEVLNGSNVPMAATALGKTLTNQGDSVVRAVDWQGAHPPNSIILLHSSNPKLEKVARQLVPGLPVVHDADYPLGGDQGTAKSTLVSIILGDDWGGLQSATPSLAPTPCSSGQPNATVTVLPPTRSDTYTAAPGAPPEAMSPGAVLAPCRRGPSTPQR